MEIISGIASLLKLTEIVFFIRDKLDNREQISEHLQSIGTLIQEVSNDLKTGTYPHSKCSQMEFYLRSIDDTIKKHLPENYYTIAKDELQKACNVEGMFGEFNNLIGDEVKQRNLDMLNHISGTFLSLAEVVKLT